MEGNERAAPIEYVVKGDREARVALYACAVCGTIYTPERMPGNADEAGRRAREAAEDCRLCASQRSDPGTCASRHEDHRRRRIASATTTTGLGRCFSDDGDCFYVSPGDAADAGETGVFGAVFRPYRIDFGALIATIVEGHHDDADVDDLEGVDDLATAVDRFNNIQTQGSYDMDDKQWQAIPQTRTFAMIKPDATARGVEDDMIADIEAAGFRVVERRRLTMERPQAEWLYREHAARDHFDALVDYTVSGEVVMLLIEGDADNVPAAFRKLMGATDHTKADPGTLRAKYAVGYRENSIHGSDSPRAAIDEIVRFMR